MESFEELVDLAHRAIRRLSAAGIKFHSPHDAWPHDELNVYLVNSTLGRHHFIIYPVEGKELAVGLEQEKATSPQVRKFYLSPRGYYQISLSDNTSYEIYSQSCALNRHLNLKKVVNVPFQSPEDGLSSQKSSFNSLGRLGGGKIHRT